MLSMSVSIRVKSSFCGGSGVLFAYVWSATVAGIEGVPVRVEVDVSGGLPGLEIAGLADAAVRESRHRVRSAVRNSGFEVPPSRITVNLSPADLHKEGSQMDLAVAAGILAASGQISSEGRLRRYMLLGELALDGTLRPVRGVLPMVISKAADVDGVVLPRDNGGEVSFLRGLDLRAAGSLSDVIRFIQGSEDLPGVDCSAEHAYQTEPYVDTFDIRGQSAAKRALEVAASGGHNMLLSGPHGVGKSMLARALPGILPDLSHEEALEVTRIQSVSGNLLPGSGLVRRRPFRAPHHTVTATALIGGGSVPRPGEITLAHRGVLFLDELPEFAPAVLNAMRQPLEDGSVAITRSRGTYRFPCRFVLVSAMNLCPCGRFGSEEQDCSCTPRSRRNYAARVSGPFLDRIDIYLSVSRVPPADLVRTGGERSSAVKERVMAARKRQERRLEGPRITCNAEMGARELGTLVSFSASARRLALGAVKKMGLSTRGYYRVLRVASTIADLEDSPRIEEEHVAEALSYRQTTLHV
jgi:magnesium chelatase family protein